MEQRAWAGSPVAPAGGMKVKSWEGTPRGQGRLGAGASTAASDHGGDRKQGRPPLATWGETRPPRRMPAPQPGGPFPSWGRSTACSRAWPMVGTRRCLPVAPVKTPEKEKALIGEGATEMTD